MTLLFFIPFILSKKEKWREMIIKKKFVLLFFFRKNSLIIFITINYDLPIQFSSYWAQEKHSRKHSRNGNQSYQETYENVSQVRPQENTQEIATSPYGGILISRLHLILPSVSPIMITRLFFLIFNGVSKIK